MFALLLCLPQPFCSVAQTTAQADVNRDGIVNFGDFLTFAVSFGTDSPAFDFNGDGEVGFVDFIHLTSRFGHVSLFYDANLETAVRTCWNDRSSNSCHKMSLRYGHSHSCKWRSRHS
jgi:hypothetical protein